MNWKTGLNYRWWTTSDFWAAAVFVPLLIGTLVFVLGAWFLGWGA